MYFDQSLGDSSNSGSESVTYTDKVASFTPSASTKRSLNRSSKLSVGSEDHEEDSIWSSRD